MGAAGCWRGHSHCRGRDEGQGQRGGGGAAAPDRSLHLLRAWTVLPLRPPTHPPGRLSAPARPPAHRAAAPRACGPRLRGRPAPVLGLHRRGAAAFWLRVRGPCGLQPHLHALPGRHAVCQVCVRVCLCVLCMRVRARVCWAGRGVRGYLYVCVSAHARHLLLTAEACAMLGAHDATWGGGWEVLHTEGAVGPPGCIAAARMRMRVDVTVCDSTSTCSSSSACCVPAVVAVPATRMCHSLSTRHRFAAACRTAACCCTVVPQRAAHGGVQPGRLRLGHRGR